MLSNSTARQQQQQQQGRVGQFARLSRPGTHPHGGRRSGGLAQADGAAAAREVSIHWHLPDAIKDMTPQQLRALTSGTVGAGVLLCF